MSPSNETHPVQTSDDQEKTLRDILDYIQAGARFLHVKTTEEDAFIQRFKEMAGATKAFWNPDAEGSRNFTFLATYDELKDGAGGAAPTSEGARDTKIAKYVEVLNGGNKNPDNDNRIKWVFKLDDKFIMDNGPLQKKGPEAISPFNSRRHPFLLLACMTRSEDTKLEQGDNNLREAGVTGYHILFVLDPAYQTYLQSRALKTLAQRLEKQTNYHFVFVFVGLYNPDEFIPRDLTEWVNCFDYPLPPRARLKALFQERTPQEQSQLADAALGLTERHVRFLLRYAEVKQVNDVQLLTRLIQKHKTNVVRAGSAFLEYIEPPEGGGSKMNDVVGGMDNLKGWVEKRKALVHRDAETDPQKRELLDLQDLPRGLLIFGISGGGKSLMVRQIAMSLELPLLRLDLGRIFGKYVGESESNLRQVIALAEAMSPCVLWIDEIEKGFAGASGDGDSGVGARVFGGFLTWMQEKTKLVFVVATANNVERIPAEMSRPGRFDGQCFVDLPSVDDMIATFMIHADRFLPAELFETLKTKDFEDQVRAVLHPQGKGQKGLTGAEIASCVQEGIRNFSTGDVSDHKRLSDCLIEELTNKRGMYGEVGLNKALALLRERAKFTAFHASSMEPKNEDYGV